MPSDRRRDAMSRMARLPRKKYRRTGKGRCQACDADGDLYDDLCDTCYWASNEGQAERIEDADR